ncbi:MAG: RNA polymerase-associated protein RapA [Candidatus Polarisedimenticolaceae bacterium]|nr:RNA polymerase-associated protein RapA [Candidatus Polarisedimenticolaceae bacterium]
MQFIPGQRWTSNTEPELGLGTLLAIEGRTVRIIFLATGDIRNYAIGNMPLSRVSFEPGDRVESHEGWFLTVEQVVEEQGLLIYQGKRDDGGSAMLAEGELSNFIQFNKPQERLFAGQIDEDRWFELRYETLQQINRLEQSPVLGLGGARTSLLPHQLYIAHEVAHRHAPRVLLADEVGLGKTIEACLILHHQLLTGRAQRAIIVVPEPLVHQWLVELLRRFNLHFSVFDEQRCQAIEASGQATNPFQAEQLVLCSLELLTQSSQRQQQVTAGEWDLLIVDEAHHLEWSEDHSSPEYQIIEQLARETLGVLLLTATPEQLGRAGHFARLRLLDPDRFYDLNRFREEEALYEPIADAVEKLMADEPLPVQSTQRLLQALGEEDAAPLLQQLSDQSIGSSQQKKSRDRLIEMLLDRHGTGRVLFRNTRAQVKGFPKRQFLPHPLVPAGQGSDPRVDWLIQTLRRYKDKKILLICAKAETVLQLEQQLRTREGINSALFHEGMSIIERDRAAAWFADMEEGVQLLLCSEIGSEGRNFQFSHHLVLFDLPLDPDLLEQRIGRLDRIGQKETIQIHVPFIKGSDQDVLQRWFHQGLNAFEKICPAAHKIFSDLQPALLKALETPGDAGKIDILIQNTRDQHIQAHAALKRGRDHLLELNSCRTESASRLRSMIETEDNSNALADYMERLFGCFAVELEAHSAGNYIIRPSDHMPCGSFPCLPDEGLTFTYQREIALRNEDRHFLTWEHPMVRDAMEMVISSETGNCAVTTAKHPLIESGTLLLEALFLLECVAPKALRAGRFLPPTTLRLVLDETFTERSSTLTHADLSREGPPIDRNGAAEIARKRRSQIIKMLSKAEQEAAERAPAIIRQALDQTLTSYSSEIRRLAALKRVNPNVRDDEIEALQQELRLLHQHIQGARLRLEAVRVVVGC